LSRRHSLAALAVACAATLAGAPAATAALQAPDTGKADGSGAACTTPPPVHVYPVYHCYTPQDIAGWYGVSALHGAGNQGAGQTIVLVDSYGSPTAGADLQKFHDAFYPQLPPPSFEQVCQGSCHDYNNTANGNGQSGPNAAEGWAGEANLDVQWAYAMAPRAHIVLLAVPPAETEGVQGFPNLFKAMSDAIARYPSGTVFSQSFGVTEQTFGGAAKTQTAKFDQVYQQAAKRDDTILASSGDDGTTGVDKQAKDSRTYPYATVGWPASSPWVTAIGGTQLQDGWRWNPTSDVPFNADGSPNLAYWQWTDGPSSEAVWNESWLPAATGGGPSAIYPRPSWQDGVASRIPGNARAIPDLAWDAAVNGGVLVYTSFFPDRDRVGWHVYGGTSASSPQVAGLIALANEQQRKSGQPPLGWLNPLIYRVGAAQPSAFRDIVAQQYGTAVSGRLDSNRLFTGADDGQATKPGPVPGWPTTSGWDMTTGFGTPHAPQFVAALRAARNAG